MTERVTIPVFPLDGVALCPGLLLPLHIFEPRYRDLLEFAMSADERLALFTPAVGHSTRRELDPPLDAIGGLGLVVQHQSLPDGRCNILLKGESRVRIHKELPVETDFRMFEVELLKDIEPDGIDMAPARAELLTLIPLHGNLSAEELVGLGKLPLQRLVDTLVMQLPMSGELRQSLFSELRIDLRLNSLVELLRPPFRPPIGPAGGIGPDDVRRN